MSNRVDSPVSQCRIAESNDGRHCCHQPRQKHFALVPCLGAGHGISMHTVTVADSTERIDIIEGTVIPKRLPHTA